MRQFNGDTIDKGFTLIEVLVVVGILALLSATLIIYSHTGERQIILFKEQARIVSTISQAKSLSIATFGQVNVPCGYGVHFSPPKNFLIFEDLANDCQDADKRWSGENETFESFQLDPAVVFENLSLTDIVFIPPNPSVVITPPQDQSTIIIKTVDGNSSTTIKVNNAGQISAQ